MHMQRSGRVSPQAELVADATEQEAGLRGNGFSQLAGLLVGDSGSGTNLPDHPMPARSQWQTCRAAMQKEGE